MCVSVMNESFSYKGDLRVSRLELFDPSESKVQEKLHYFINKISDSIFSLAFPRGTLRDVTRGENAAARRLCLTLQGALSTTGPL